jgi:hypothetical protein
MFSATLGDEESSLTLRQELRLDAMGKEEKEEKKDTKEILTILKWNGRFVKEN